MTSARPSHSCARRCEDPPNFGGPEGAQRPRESGNPEARRRETAAGASAPGERRGVDRSSCAKQRAREDERLPRAESLPCVRYGGSSSSVRPKDQFGQEECGESDSSSEQCNISRRP